MYVKICGTTHPEDAALAVEAGADALGFIFAPSPRRIAPETAAVIATPAGVQRVGIFVDPTLEDVLGTVRTARLDAVQLHGARSREHHDAQCALARRLRPYLAEAQDHAPSLIGAMHFPARGEEAAPEDTFLADLAVASALYDAILLDSRTATATGGTGRTFDWQAAARSLAQAGHALPRIILAGGLHPENVAEAIRTLHPWGVDVVTGVESTPGRKHPEKLRAFVTAVRAFETGLPFNLNGFLSDY